MQYPNDTQCAVMYAGAAPDLDAIVRTFLKIESTRSAAHYNPLEIKQGVFYQFYGTNDLMVSIELIVGPAKMEVFQAALSSAVTRMIFPDVGEALMLHKSHVLINVRSGVLGKSEALTKLLATIGRQEEGHSLIEFQNRLSCCALLSRIALEEGDARAVHWTQSDQILKPDTFETMAGLDAPGPLNIHPYLFGHQENGQQLVGIRTFGARHFIGREIRIQPSVLPWAANYETILTFLRVATVENGYIIPDGDTFGNEDKTQSYRVRHLDAEEGDVPFYEIEPLLYADYGFKADGYVERTIMFDDRSAPSALMPRDGEARAEMLDEWREKRGMAEGIGGRFEVRPKLPGVRGGGDAPPPSNPPPRPGPAPAPTPFARPVFGRREFGRKV